MATTSNATPAVVPPAKSRTGSIVVPKMTDPGLDASKEQQQQQQAGDVEAESDSERQLVSSLAKLQKLEAMVCVLSGGG